LHTAGGAGVRMMFGIDSVHGAIYVKGATVFPQQINAGASFNRDLAQRMGQVTAKDTRAAGASQLRACRCERSRAPTRTQIKSLGSAVCRPSACWRPLCPAA
jgi:hypothetical protein